MIGGWATIKVGDKVWYFERRAVYGASCYRRYFIEKFIIGDTRQSWVLGDDMTTRLLFGIKILKRESVGIIYDSELEVDKVCWVNENRYEISDLVTKCNNYDLLQQIKKILESNN
jgi:hypothetical protein